MARRIQIRKSHLVATAAASLAAAVLTAALHLSAQADPPAANVAVQPKPAGLDLGGARVLARLSENGPPVSINVQLRGAKTVYLVADGGAMLFDVSWLSPAFAGQDGKKTPVSDADAKAAAGESFRDAVASADKPLTVAGRAHKHGFATHGTAVIALPVPAGSVSFEAVAAAPRTVAREGAAPPPALIAVLTRDPRKPFPVDPNSGSYKQPYGFEAAREQMKAFKTPAGLEGRLYAAEPMVQNPTCFDVDPRGRVWVAEAVNYRSSFQGWGYLRPEGDRIVILEDTDGDGVADKEIVFHQDAEMEAPLGVCVLDERTAVVSCSPYVWLLEDTDGDGKADRKTVLLKTAGGFQGDHAVHSFVFGPDGKLYFNFGNFCSALQWPDGSPVVDLAGNEVKTSGKPYRQGLVFRCDLDRAARKVANVETLGWNFRNNYEVAVDSFGTLWQSDNDDDGNRGVRINYVMEFGNFGYVGELDGSGWSKPRTNMEKEIPLRHWHLNDPGVVPNLLQTGSGSPTGICVNEGSLLGPAFENQVIHADAGPRVVRAYPAAKDGAGFSATMVDILTGPDSWYRPADVVIAPDGSLFIADWYDPGVGGHGMADNIPGRIRGRIYRVAPTAYAAAYKVTPPDLSTAAGAVEAIKSPCGSTRAAAFAKLRELGAAAEPELLKLWKSENPRLRARAIQLLARIDGQAAKYIEAAAADADANLRVVAVRMARALSAGVLPLVAKLADDADPAVRRECAIALRGRKETEVPALWARLAAKHDGKDRWYLEALGIGAAGNDEACFAAWLSGAGAGENWNTPAGRDIVWRVRAGGAVEYLVKLLTDPRADPRDLPRYLREFDFLPDSDAKNQALLKVATAGAMHPVTAIDALQRLGKTPLKDNPEVKTALGKLLDANKGKPGFIEVAQAFGVKDRPADMLASALSDPRDPRSLSAVAGLVADPSAKTMLASTLAKGAESAPAAAELLGLSGNKEAAAMLRGVVSGDTPADPAARTAAVRSLASSAVGAAVLVSLAEENKLPADLKAVAGLALAMVNYPGISEKATKLLPGPDLAGGAKLPPIAELVKRPGDAERGRAVFLRKESSCIGCHRVGELGADVGPGLTEIGSKYDKAALYESILNPSAAIAFGYETTKILTADGTVVVGIVRSETKSEIVMVLPGGAVQKVDPKEVDKRVKEKVSLMPEGLGKLFSPQDLADLVEYLSSLKAKKP